MPYLKNMTINWADTRVGDVVYPQASTIAQRTAKRTRVEVVLDNGTTLNPRMDEAVTIDREALTEQEEAEQAQRSRVRRVRTILADVLEQDPVTFIESAVAKYRDGRAPKPLAAWDIERIMEVQETHLVARCIDEWADGYLQHTDSEYVALLAAMHTAHDRFEVGSRMANPLSRSTNVIHNIADDLRRYAAERLLDRMLGYGLTMDDCKAAKWIVDEARKAQEVAA